MKKFLRNLGLGLCGAALTAMSATATNDGYFPKEEMRAAWVAALGIDFPLSKVAATESAAEAQKKEIIKYLDNMKAAGLNCVFIHMRPMADRLYKLNSYNGVTVNEPWSHYLTGKRGVEPNYDPLQFWIDEGHKRGMEMHAWLNPYRYCNYSSSTVPEEGFNPYSTEEDKALFESGMLIRHSYQSGSKYVTNFIFNPALDSSIQRICDVCTVLVGNYDLDGILFDDYFYPDGIVEGASAPDYANYEAYLAEGGTMSMGDWRRANVNRMVETVYKHCKAVKPWLRFGISPAGAAGRGLRPEDGLPALSQFCAAGDWQYNGIYSDPMDWLRKQNLDWISPQIYWTTTHSTNPFGPMTDWWTLVANKFGRPMFASTYLSGLANNNNDAYREELCNQVTLERKFVEKNGGQPGVVFFSAKWVDGATNGRFEAAVKEACFSREALMPPMTWHFPANPGLVKNLRRDGNTLKWDAIENMRYSVYAVPQGQPQENFDGDTEYLLGFVYTPEFELPTELQSGYQYAVCAYDRYGYEYTARFVGAPDQQLDAPAVTSPTGGKALEVPFNFTWAAVANARSYTVEVSADATFATLLGKATVSGTECAAEQLGKLPIDTELYWRVVAAAPNYECGVSAGNAFQVKEVRISTPADGTADVSLAPVFTWTLPERDVIVEIATADNFAEKNMVFSAQATGGSYQMPKYYLSGLTDYFARLTFTDNAGQERHTDAVHFSTTKAEPEVPTVKFPMDGGEFYSDSHFEINPVEGPKSVRLEVSAATSFTGRNSYIVSSMGPGHWADPNQGNQVKVGSSMLRDGYTYYIRVRANFKTDYNSSADTEYSPVTSFVYVDKTGVQSTLADGCGLRVDYSDPSAPQVLAATPGSFAVYDLSGQLQFKAEGTESIEVRLAAGAYIVRYCGSLGAATAKLIIK